MTRPKERRSLIGLRFGKWLVIGSSHDKYVYRVLCKCDCGVEKEVESFNLLNGHSKSCGCKKHCELPSGQAAFNSLYSSYKSSANKRNIHFEISKEHFEKLTKESCRYCGTEPSSVFTNTRGTSPYVYNGVDRVHNQLGYTVDNCVACCKICNQAKLDMPLDKFLSWVCRLVKFQNLKETVKPVGRKQHHVTLH